MKDDSKPLRDRTDILNIGNGGHTNADVSMGLLYHENIDYIVSLANAVISRANHMKEITEQARLDYDLSGKYIRPDFPMYVRPDGTKYAIDYGCILKDDYHDKWWNSLTSEQKMISHTFMSSYLRTLKFDAEKKAEIIRLGFKQKTER